MKSNCLFAAVFGLCVLGANTASAEVAIWLDGPSALLVEDHLRSQVNGLNRTISTSQFRSKLAQAGVNGKINGSLDALIAQSGDGLVAAARQLNADAVLVGQTKKKKTTLSMSWVVLDASSGDVLGRGTHGVYKSHRGARKWSSGTLTNQLGRALSQAKPASPSPAPEPPKATAAAKPAAPVGSDWGSSSDAGNSLESTASESSSSGLGLKTEAPAPLKKGAPEGKASIVEGGLGYTIGGRDFGYQGVTSYGLRPYQAFGAQGLRVDLRFYPGAFVSRTGLWKMFGVEARYQEFFGLQTGMAGLDERVGTTWRYLYFGALSRFDLSFMTLTARLGYGNTNLSFPALSSAAPDDLMPQAQYSQLVLGADATFDFDPFVLRAGLAYQHAFASGPMAAAFPSHMAFGMEAQAGFGYRIMYGLEARALASYSLINMSLSPAADSTYQATGALDQYFSATLGVAYTY